MGRNKQYRSVSSSLAPVLFNSFISDILYSDSTVLDTFVDDIAIVLMINSFQLLILGGPESGPVTIQSKFYCKLSINRVEDA